MEACDDALLAEALRASREEAERALKKESELARERARKAADMMKMDDEEEADMTKPGARGPDGKLLVPTFPEVHAVIAQNGERPFRVCALASALPASHL